MSKCPTCGHGSDEQFYELVAHSLGPNLKLYDFGGGVHCVPRQDPDGNYLRGQIGFVYEPRNDKRPMRFLRFEMDASDDFSIDGIQNEILKRLDGIKEKFETESINVSEGAGLPSRG